MNLQLMHNNTAGFTMLWPKQGRRGRKRWATGTVWFYCTEASGRCNLSLVPTWLERSLGRDKPGLSTELTGNLGQEDRLQNSTVHCKDTVRGEHVLDCKTKYPSASTNFSPARLHWSLRLLEIIITQFFSFLRSDRDIFSVFHKTKP